MSKGLKPKDVFDVDRIRQIIRLMEEHNLSEVDLQQGDEKIKLARGGVAPSLIHAPAYSAPPMYASTAAQAAAATPVASVSDANIKTICSPMVGTFYTKPNPEAPSFVKVGDKIGPDTVVCIVEAMKVFNEIPAEISGEVIEILLVDGTPVDFNKPLIRVRTSS
jgi:acetyl-CoA carboxylase biotin carboxyl carrier protein